MIGAATPATADPPRMLLVESRSPWESGDVADFLGVASSLLAAGSAVHLYLIQNGVLWLRRDADALRRLRSGFTGRLRISCDDFSLAQRGIAFEWARQYGDIGSIDALVAEMAERDVKTIWHS